MAANFFKQAIGGKVLLNIQANSLESAKAAAELLGPAVIVGVMAKDFPVIEEGVAYIQRLHGEGVQVSAGLGDGSAEEWERALKLALAAKPLHLNQVFPAAALSQYVLRLQGAPTIVNAMVRPTGTPGMVHIGTGPLSQASPDAVVSVDSALSMMQEMGIESVKFFPIQGTGRLDEVRAVAKAVAGSGMMLEPTGGITPDNAAELVRACLEEGVTKLMPHLYGSLKNASTNDLDLEKLKLAAQQIRAVCGA